MDDTISRQEAINALMSWVEEHKDNAFGGCLFHWTGIKALLENLPPAQPEIIRCRDCKHWDTTWTNDFSPNYHYCPMVDGVRKEDWYCADAERREVTT